MQAPAEQVKALPQVTPTQAGTRQLPPTQTSPGAQEGVPHDWARHRPRTHCRDSPQAAGQPAQRPWSQAADSGQSQSVAHH
jgi:hypothetical protein